MTHGPARKKETGQWIPAVWCSQHDQHPSDCWDLHNPGAHRPADNRAADWERWLAQAWARIDSEVRGATTTTGADPPATGQRNSVDPADRDHARHGDQLA